GSGPRRVRERARERTRAPATKGPSARARSRQRSPEPSRWRPEVLLLDFDFATDFFDGGLDLLGLIPGDAFLDGLRCRIDDVLGFLEAEPGELADDLDDRDLVRADLGQGRGELRLLLDRRGGCAVRTANGGRGRGDCGRGGGGDAVALLEALDEFGKLENGHL